MQRKDREIKNIKEILKILDSVEIMHLGLKGEEYPYVVPLNFGYKIKDEVLYFYIHSGIKGKKIDLIKENKNVCVEFSRFKEYKEINKNITTYYESVIGYGEVKILEDIDEKIDGLKALMEHCNFKSGEIEKLKCMNGLNKVCVMEIKINKISGKRNPNT